MSRSGAEEEFDVPFSLRTSVASGIADEFYVGVTSTEQYGRLRFEGTIHEAAEKDLPFAVHIAPNVLALDFDGEDAVERAEQLHLELLLNGYLPVTCDSGGDGGSHPHRHLFCRIDDPDDMAAWKARAAIDGRNPLRTGAFTRPPWARHRNGGRSIPLYPTDPNEVRRRLVGGGRRLGPLPPVAAHYILAEVMPEGLASEALYEVATVLSRRAWSRDEALLLLTSPGYAIAITYAERMERRGRDTDWFIDRIWPDAAEAAGRLSAAMVNRLRTLYRAQIRSRKHSRRSIATDLRVLEVLLRAGAWLGRAQVSMSIREFQANASIGSPNTVRAALARLIEGGVIRRLVGARLLEAETTFGNPDRKGNSAWYELEFSPEDLENLVETEPSDNLMSAGFRNSTGYGTNGARVLDAVSAAAGGVSQADIIRSTGLSRSTVARHLAVLERLGLVRRAHRRWMATGMTMDESLAPRAYEADERALVRFTHESERYQAYLAATSEDAG